MDLFIYFLIILCMCTVSYKIPPPPRTFGGLPISRKKLALFYCTIPLQASFPLILVILITSLAFPSIMKSHPVNILGLYFSIVALFVVTFLFDMKKNLSVREKPQGFFLFMISSFILVLFWRFHIGFEEFKPISAAALITSIIIIISCCIKAQSYLEVNSAVWRKKLFRALYDGDAIRKGN